MQQGLIDVNGKVVFPFVYDYMSSPSCGLVCCRKPGEKFGFLDLSGGVVLPCQFHDASGFDPSSGTTWIMHRDGEKRRYHLIDRTGRVINKTPYDNISSPRCGRIRFCDVDREGYLDENGEVVIPAQFLDATDFAFGLAAVRLVGDSDYYYIDPAGNIKFGPYSGVVAYWSEFRDGLALVQPPLVYPPPKKPQTQYINLKGKVVIELEPPCRGEPFSCGFASVLDRVKNLYGYIDTSGRYFIPPSFTGGGSFYSGYAQVKTKEETFFIDTRGNRVPCPAGYQVTGTQPLCSRMCVTDETGRWGAADLDGNLIIDCVYKGLHTFSEDHTVATL